MRLAFSILLVGCLSSRAAFVVSDSWGLGGFATTQTNVPAITNLVRANSGSYPDVAVAISVCPLGGTVLIPPGTNSWTQTMNVGSITLMGSGTNATVIRDETPVNLSYSIIQINPGSTFLTRITQLQFLQGVTNNLNTANSFLGKIVTFGGASNWRVDHCVFNNLTGKFMQMQGDSYGCIDHNTFLTSNSKSAIEVDGNNFGDADWAAPNTLGTSNNVFAENNTFIDSNNFGSVDISSGGHAVFRYNSFIGSYINTHGTETGQRFRSDRCIEAYSNVFFYPTNHNPSFFCGVDIRGGTAIVCSNWMQGYNHAVQIDCFRMVNNDPNYAPFYGVTGYNGWDSNGPVVGQYRVIWNSTLLTNAIKVAANLTNNAFVGCTIFSTNSFGGFTNSGACGLNSTDTFFIEPANHSWLQLQANSNDTVFVHYVYPSLDQPGRGQGLSLSNLANPTAFWPTEAVETVYCFSNINQAPTYLPPYTQWVPGSPNDSEAFNPYYPALLAGRDYTNSAVPAFWHPYQYPHPLDQ